MKKLFLTVLMIAVMVSLTAAVQNNRQNVLKEWEVILCDAPDLFWADYNQVFRVLKTAPREQQSWSNELSILTDRLLAAVKSGNIKAYQACFVNPLADEKQLEAEMKIWRQAIESRRLKKCAWFRNKKNQPLYGGIVLATGDLERQTHIKYHDIPTYKKYRNLHFRKIMYAEKNDTGYKFITNFSSKELEHLIKTEVYVNLKDKWRTRVEYKLYQQLRKQLEAERSSQLDREYELRRFRVFKKSAHLLSEKYDYSEKQMRELYLELKKRNDEVSSVPWGLTRFQRGVLLGHIKVIVNPILFLHYDKPIKKEKPVILGEILKQWFYYKLQHPFYKKGLGKSDKPTVFQLIAYEKIKFRNIVYYNFTGIHYSYKKINVVRLNSYVGFVYNKNKQEWRTLRATTYAPGNGKTFLLGKKLNDAEEKYIIFSSLTKYFAPLERVITLKYRSHNIKKSVYDELLKKAKLYKYFRVRKPAECVLYKPGLDILKLPTIPAEDFNFPELDK